MAKNQAYYYDKIPQNDIFYGHLLGEVQSNYNISFVIDGTKDSAKIEVLSFNISEEIEPYTIIFLQGTNTYWVVSSDKVEKYINESGYFFKHNLQLTGAVELLNARDLTDCGFFANQYTIREFVDRLIKLSSLEFRYYSINANGFDLDKIVDYTKTFENYTLLTALRELFNGYNCDIKVDFFQNTYGIFQIALNIVQKTGRSNLDTLDESAFGSVQEQKSISKNSFGTSVVSNAESVISSKAKTFPSVGTIKLSSSQYKINNTNAILRLPTSVYKVNWVQMVRPVGVKIFKNAITTFYVDDFDKIREVVLKECGSFYPTYINDEQIDEVSRKIVLAMRTTLYTGWKYNPATKVIIAPTDNANWYAPPIRVEQRNAGVYQQTTYSGGLYIANKEDRDSMEYPMGTISWERGKDYLEDFEFLTDDNQSGQARYSYLTGYGSTDLRISDNAPVIYEVSVPIGNPPVSTTYKIQFDDMVYITLEAYTLTAYQLAFRVNYIPMTDIKIKYDNGGMSRDTHLYNQAGKLTDSVAFSKMLLSYSKEIESNNIVKYGIYYDYNDIPKVGQTVSINNELYVISSVSLDIVDSELNGNYEYYFVGEFTLNKSVSVKSLIVNPETDVRSFGIPQKFNVKRKQLYRDFYELAHTTDSQSDNDYYMEFDKVVNFTNYYKNYDDHVAVIKIKYDEPIGGDNNDVSSSDTWYYQLDTSLFIMKKAIYEVVDFKDNNIIGYGSQNVYSGFDITRVITGQNDTINVPIQYTDDNGKVKEFYIAMCDRETLISIYDSYLQNEEETQGVSVNTALYNYSYFIPQQIYNGSSNGKSLINEESLYGTSGSVWTPTEIDITDMLNGFSGSASDLSFGNITLYNTYNEQAELGTDYTYTIVKQGSSYLVQITALTTLGSRCNFYSITGFYRAGYYGASTLCDFLIVEEEYNKDSIEVPVFEYSCQIDDSDDVDIGENIFDTMENSMVYIYSYILVDKNKYSENNCYNIRNRLSIASDIITTPTFVEFAVDEEKVEIKLYGQATYDTTTDTISTGIPVVPTTQMFSGKDIIIYRHKVPNNYTTTTSGNVDYVNSVDDMLMIIRNTSNIVIVGNRIVLQVNHYKIK